VPGREPPEEIVKCPQMLGGSEVGLLRVLDVDVELSQLFQDVFPMRHITSDLHLRSWRVHWARAPS